MSIIEVDHEELKVTIDELYDKKIPLFIQGGIGIGKSDTVAEKARDIAKKRGRKFVEWNKLKKQEKYKIVENPKDYFFLMDSRLAMSDPTDLKGLPDLNGHKVIRTGEKVVEWQTNLWFYVACLDEAEGIIFLDELNLAPPSVQAAAYQLINDRCLGECSLSEGVLVIGAGNRDEDRANIFTMPRPLQNRFTWVQLKKPYIGEKMRGDWGEWAMNHGVDTRIITYLVQHPSHLCPDQKDKHITIGAYPTPRSWAKFCSPLIKGKEDLKWIEAFASMAVGDGAAKQLKAHIKFRDSIKLTDILKKPELAKKIEGLDLLYSLSSLASEWYDVHFKKEKDNKYSGLEKVLQIVKYVEMENPEMGMLILRFCRAKHEKEFREELPSLPTWKEIKGEYRKYLLT